MIFPTTAWIKANYLQLRGNCHDDYGNFTTRLLTLLKIAKNAETIYHNVAMYIRPQLTQLRVNTIT